MKQLLAGTAVRLINNFAQNDGYDVPNGIATLEVPRRQRISERR